MTIPVRIQRQRRRGWRMPPNAVYVGRPTEWGNPFHGEGPFDRALVAGHYRRWLHSPNSSLLRERVVALLRGKDLVCWCPLDGPCHADALLELANQP